MIVKSMARVANVMDVSRNADTSSTYSGMNPSFRRGDVDVYSSSGTCACSSNGNGTLSYVSVSVSSRGPRRYTIMGSMVLRNREFRKLWTSMTHCGILIAVVVTVGAPIAPDIASIVINCG